jgi:hypothetical protein
MSIFRIALLPLTGLLVAAMLWSLQLACQVSRPFNCPARALLLLNCNLAVGQIGYGWWLQFWGWN